MKKEMYKQAPKLHFDGAKRTKEMSYWGVDIEIMDYINNNLSGREGNAIKLMNLLLGTAEGFGVSIKWVCDRTGMKESAYYRTRDSLVEKGWLTCGDGYIQVNIKTIRERLNITYSQEEKNENKTIHNVESMTIRENNKTIHDVEEQTIHHVYYNKKEQENITEKETEKKEAFSANAEKSSGNLPQAEGSLLPKVKLTENIGKYSSFEDWFNGFEDKVIETPREWNYQ